ncbi:hypothetical protein P153DRAFT_147956 [Dothidotthia symphoricarpi CBS 119687]|uniref:Uncharacterized protein n=1 Tax=Dothidotthia symphoricarpi CBS 119687 TaxID=1392245 RepID=A0A6A5ZXT1_9PLEO|nr:uncharacterized protein P153DRAFT_147956 [Dothidotthia symphoricarpi CBS 119687]KAF2123713.1 hypothetical protein P153DRAFT_147956 [Dothidotthia symphoricarpi CBS 119687]
MFTWSPETGTTFQAFTTNAPLQPGPPPPPTPPPAQDSASTDVNRVFIYRLKWSVLDSPSKAEILSLDAEDNPQWTPLFLDPVADEAATDPPQSRVQISLEPLDAWEHWQQAEKDPPAPGFVENTDGRPISVKQLMQATHDYAVPLRRLLCRCCDIWGPEKETRARFYFTGLGLGEGTPESPYTRLGVDVSHDMDEDGHQLAFYLETIETVYRNSLASH